MTCFKRPEKTRPPSAVRIARGSLLCSPANMLVFLPNLGSRRLPSPGDQVSCAWHVCHAWHARHVCHMWHSQHACHACHEWHALHAFCAYSDCLRCSTLMNCSACSAHFGAKLAICVASNISRPFRVPVTVREVKHEQECIAGAQPTIFGAWSRECSTVRAIDLMMLVQSPCLFIHSYHAGASGWHYKASWQL